MELEDIIAAAIKTDVKLPKIKDNPLLRSPEATDALFHVPLLALATLIISTSGAFPTAALGTTVIRLLVEQFSTPHSKPHALEASLTLRRKCAEALAFLEESQLVTVTTEEPHLIEITKFGKSLIWTHGKQATDLGLLIRQLRASQGRARARGGNHGH